LWSCVAEPHRWKPEMLRLAQTQTVETIKIPTLTLLHSRIKETRPSAAELYSREKVTRHTTAHGGTAVLSARRQFVGERHQWRAANAVPRLGTSNVEGRRKPRIPSGACNPHGGGDWGSPVHSAVGCLAWSNGRSFPHKKPLWSNPGVTHHSTLCALQDLRDCCWL
jgi:hypothetical protein